jgi:threonine synthase
MNMLYVSTRGNAPHATGSQVLFEGLAPDGGLRMPYIYPSIDLAALRAKSYHHVAHHILHAFFPEVPEKNMWDIIRKAYSEDVFSHRDVTPVTKIHSNLWKLGLSHGPTCAFKDIPMRFVACMMEYLLAKSGKKCNVIVATSGDTGKAALSAFSGKENVSVTVLTPYGRMSPMQQAQTYTVEGSNVHNLAIDGTFDDCQALVKGALNSPFFSRAHKLAAVNSINWARIAAQSVYFVYAYLQVTERNDEQVTFCIPSGNGGHFVSADVARRMGLPISIIVATNENDVLHQFFQTGNYRARTSAEVIATSSPSMNIAVSSNFERWVFEYIRRQGAIVSNLFGRSGGVNFLLTGEMDIPFPVGRSVSLTSGMATEEDVLKNIIFMYEVYGVLVDPHTAVGMHVALIHRSRVGLNDKIVVTETALPCMFAETIEALGISVPIPAPLQALKSKSHVYTRLPNSLVAVKEYMRNACA